ncbi:MAG: rRNA maturation RNase YbeY, partial [Deltaproteobacteria bacterium]|nr:rRNA maturation RNase YbeY [Deltaproteobacteria bacterium]
MSLVILNRQRAIRFDRKTVALRLEAVVRAAGVEDREVALVFLSDAAIHRMNRKWRGIDRATDCISFAACEGEGAQYAGSVLGDIFISLQTAERQARGSIEDEVVALFAHSLLHLMGHDHGT